MKCLITGGAGFIGSHIQDKLIELGHDVAVLDNFRSGKRENLNPKSRLFEVDVRDKEKLSAALAEFKPQTVFHLAAQNEVPYSMAHPEEDFDINIKGMLNLLEACQENGVKKVIYSNTGGALYGEVPETDLPITEDHLITKPSSFYGVSKLCAEYYLKLFGQAYGLSWTSLRYSNVYGPRQSGNREAGIVAMFVDKMLKGEQPTVNGDGSHTRDYIYVGDVIAANIKAMDQTRNDYFNISTGARTSNLEVFDSIEAALKTGLKPKFGPQRSGDVLHNALSPAKAKKLLGWSPKVKFHEGIKLTLKYYQ